MRLTAVFAAVAVTACLAEPSPEEVTSSSSALTTVTAIPRGAVWRYWDRGGDLGTPWRGQGFDDGTWASGAGPLGYGETGLATTVGYGPSSSSKYITTYFRRTFTVDDPDRVTLVRGEIMFDDGVVVYLNGTRIGAASMPDGTVTASTLALGHEASGYNLYDWSAHRGLLVAGVNTISVEVHQATASSSDLVFDLALELEVDAPPRNIPRYATWAYWDGGGDLGTAWRSVGFDDSGWARGSAPLGYGESYLATTVGYGPDAANKYVTTYFRGELTVDDPATAGDLSAELLYDDGVVIYVNGQLLAGASMPSPSTPATYAHGHEALFPQYEGWTFPGSGDLLVAGVNVIAVEVHNASAASSDLVFDMAVTQESAPPPPPEDIERGSEWTYWDKGGDLGTTWRVAGYPLDTWGTGRGPLGYGENYLRTVISYGFESDEKWITAYFRRTFHVDDPSVIGSMRGELMYDDGIVVYINGQEIERQALIGGVINGYTLASGHETGNNYETFDWSDATGALVAGDNVIAVEVHQQSRSSSDLTFDLALQLETTDTCPVMGCPRLAYRPGADLYDVWAGPGGVTWAVGDRGMVGRRATAEGGAWCWCAPGQGDGWLDGVSGTADDDVWIVGGDVEGSIVLHFDGTGFEEVDIGSDFEHLMGVWSNAPDDVWIIGSAGGHYHFDGTTWTAGRLGGDHHAASLWGASAGDVWIGGDFYTTTPEPTKFAELHRLDPATGTFVTQASYPQTNPGQAVFKAISGDGPTDVWAVGDRYPWGSTQPTGLAAHFDGTGWTEVAIPDFYKIGLTYTDVIVDGPGPYYDVWVAGGPGPIVEFNGTSWSMHDNLTRNILGLSAYGGGLWAVGYDGKVLRRDVTTGNWVLERPPTP